MFSRPGAAATRPGSADGSGTAARSLRSARWAGEHGMNFLTSSVVSAKAEESQDFARIQLSHVRAFRAHHPDGNAARVSQGLVVIPTDSASPAQRRGTRQYARGAAAADGVTAGPGPAAVLARPASARRTRSPSGCTAHAGVPRDRRGRVRAAVHVRARGLRADPHRPGDPSRAGPGLEPGRSTLRQQVERVGLLDLGAGDAQQVEHGVEVGHVDRRVCLARARRAWR